MVKIDASEYETNWLTDSPKEESEGESDTGTEETQSGDTPTDETQQAKKALEQALDSVKKQWVPYRGDRGGVGWQNSNDPDDIRYVDEPPGEVAEGFEWADEVNSRSPPPDTVSFGDELEDREGPHTEEGSFTNEIAEIRESSGAGWEKVQTANETVKERTGATRVSLAKASDEEALRTAEVLATLHDHNPEIMNPSFMMVRPPTERNKAAGAYDWESNRVEVHPEKGYGNQKRKEWYSKKKKSSGHPYGTLIHELGHLAHQREMEEAENVSGDEWESAINEGIDVVEEAIPDDKQINEVTDAVSSYAARNPLEFVAEVWTGKLTGHEYPDWVWDTYEEFGGADIPDVTFGYEMDGKYARKSEENAGLPEELEAESETVWRSFVEWVDNSPTGEKMKATTALSRAFDSITKDKWIPYRGPQGGEGWQNVNNSDDVRYGISEPPGDVPYKFESFVESDWGETDKPESNDFGDVDFSRSNEHGVIPEEEQRKLRDHFVEKHGEEVVNDFYSDYGWLNEWKAHREIDEAVKLGVAMSRALGMDEENVKSYEDIDPDSITEEHVELAKDLHEASKTWFREKFGEETEVSRGFKDGGFQMLEALFKDDEDYVTLSGNEMDNWSWKRDSPVEWGRERSKDMGAIANDTRSVNDVIFTIDGIAGDFTNHNDSAVTFDGETKVNKKNISVEPEFTSASFYPFRSLEEQNDSAIKKFVSNLDDAVFSGFNNIDDETSERIVDRLRDIREYFKENDVSESYIEATNGAIENAEKHW